MITSSPDKWLELLEGHSLKHVPSQDQTRHLNSEVARLLSRPAAPVVEIALVVILGALHVLHRLLIQPTKSWGRSRNENRTLRLFKNHFKSSVFFSTTNRHADISVDVSDRSLTELDLVLLDKLSGWESIFATPRQAQAKV